jgi:hypothetical protein
MSTWVWILIVIVAVVIVAIVLTFAMRERRTTKLRQRFGAEYDRTVEASEDRRDAEYDLRDREKQRAALDIKTLPESERMRFAIEWRDVQERFVDQPANAVAAADDLVYRVMAARGYPMYDFEEQANLVSVDHPSVVENYRAAHGIFGRTQARQATTEDMRAALLHYRALFDELLQAQGDAVDSNAMDGNAVHGGIHDGVGATDANAADPATAPPTRPLPAAETDYPQQSMERGTR